MYSIMRRHTSGYASALFMLALIVSPADNGFEFWMDTRHRAAAGTRVQKNITI
jgi:hypothetical protein